MGGFPCVCLPEQTAHNLILRRSPRLLPQHPGDSGRTLKIQWFRMFCHCFEHLTAIQPRHNPNQRPPAAAPDPPGGAAAVPPPPPPGPGLGFGILDLELGFGVWDLGLRLGIWELGLGFGFGIGIWDWDLGLGFGIGIAIWD